MARKKRLEGVESARVATVFGLGNLAPSYLQFVQLWLNVDEALGLIGFYQSVAALTAAKNPIPDSWITTAIVNPLEASKWRRFDLKRLLPPR